MINILIVDDSFEMHEIIEAALLPNIQECQLIGAGNGIEAIKIIETLIPDLIITDWDMPLMNGVELVKYIRNDSRFADIPIIMISGMMVNSENLWDAFKTGVSDFIRKPFSSVELVARVNSLLLTYRSIKEIKDLNNVIFEHARFIQSILNAVPLPMVFYSIEGLIIDCNNTFEKLINKTHQEIIGQHFYTLNPSFLQMKVIDTKMLKDAKEKSETEVTINENSAIHTFLFTNTIYFDSTNKPEGILSIMSDITELKTAHQLTVEQKKRELVMSAMKLIQTNHLNEKLIADLDELDKHTDKEGKEIIKQILSKYNQNTTNSTWKEFEARFGRVYEDFYLSLSQLHPNLTPTEKKICALLRLNLTSKEIATLTLQDAKSVDMARYRLRKKLNLLQNENIVDYLMKI